MAAMFSHLAIALSIVTFLASTTTLAQLNAIDQCLRKNPNWRSQRQQLAACSEGFAGKMMNNFGKDVKLYEVTDPSDDPLNPKPGSLRYGAALIPGKKWIIFQKNVNIVLREPLFISSNTAIDGRGANVHISGMGCLMIDHVINVIVHGLNIHDCKLHTKGARVMGPAGKIIKIPGADGDAIRMVSASKIWIDHNTLYSCADGLVDASRGTTSVTISNNRFMNQNKVMMLGHDDVYTQDKNMRVTVAFNHFGPNCIQRMPRVRHGFAHVVNNFYEAWAKYAIGASSDPTVKSQNNFFVAPKSDSKEVTWCVGNKAKFYSVGDILENGAIFKPTGNGDVKPPYVNDQQIQIGDARSVPSLTSSAGVLKY